MTDTESPTEKEDSWTDLSDMAKELDTEEDASYVHVNFVDMVDRPEPRPKPKVTKNAVLPPPVLSPEECAALFDVDGRLVKEAVLRKSLFERK